MSPVPQKPRTARQYGSGTNWLTPNNCLAKYKEKTLNRESIFAQQYDKIQTLQKSDCILAIRANRSTDRNLRNVGARPRFQHIPILKMLGHCYVGSSSQYGHI